MQLEVLQTHTFKKAMKRLHANQKKAVEEAIKQIIKYPTVGQAKKGDLDGIRVYKFRMLEQLSLLAYQHHANQLILVALGSHENFYRDLKNH